ncbi:hypothetical protein BaRGS_00027725 [Batillaria attramentaria]|uniref:Uncharacterized protein n=1 Tax=Batillaria attramentaria TaxID=370345 RepID=A0ABD0K2A6_9CAEN
MQHTQNARPPRVLLDLIPSVREQKWSNPVFGNNALACRKMDRVEQNITFSTTPEGAELRLLFSSHCPWEPRERDREINRRIACTALKL